MEEINVMQPSDGNKFYQCTVLIEGENPDNGKVQAGSIGLPFMRIDQEMFDSWVLDDRILDGQGMFCR